MFSAGRFCALWALGPGDEIAKGWILGLFANSDSAASIAAMPISLESRRPAIPQTLYAA
jgi:hypothetical protein